MEGKSTTITNLDDGTSKTFTYDYSYWSCEKNHPNYANQEKVYSDLGSQVLDNAWSGYNTSLFAYGQTGAGKSYSVVGYGTEKGIVPRVSEELFKKMSQNTDSTISFRVELSMFEIYNEEIRDLLNPSRGTLEQLTQFVQSKIPVRSFKEISDFLEKGNQVRTIKATNMNTKSSRAHTVFQISFSKIQKVKQGEKEVASEKRSLINLIDLAGSERAEKSGGGSEILKEGININKSLTNLGMVINKLAEASKSKREIHIPYRDSKLTFLLKECLGGNSKTIVMAAISPSHMFYQQSLSTLQYASRAKLIQTKAVVNEDSTVKMIRDLKAENDRLKKLLEGKASGVVSEEMEKVQEQYHQSQKLLKEMMATMEEKQKEIDALSAAHKEALEKAGLTQTADATKFAKLSNLNEDPLLTDTLQYFFIKPSTIIGCDSKQCDIVFSGVGISAKHCIVTCQNSEVYSIECCDPAAMVMVNGKQLTKKTVLHTSDRVIFGNNFVFQFINPKEPSNFSGTITWNFAQKEVFTVEEDLRNKIKALQDQYETEKKAHQVELESEYKKLEEAKKALEMNNHKVQQDERITKMYNNFISAIAKLQQEKKERELQAAEEKHLALLAVQDTEINVLVNEANSIAKQFNQPFQYSKKLKVDQHSAEVVVEVTDTRAKTVLYLKKESFEAKLIQMRELFQFAKSDEKVDITAALSKAFNYTTKLIGVSVITAKQLMNQKNYKFPTINLKNNTENGCITAELQFDTPINATKSPPKAVIATLFVKMVTVRPRYNKNVHVELKFFMDQSFRQTPIQVGGKGEELEFNFTQTYHISANYYDELVQYIEGEGEITFHVYGERNNTIVEKEEEEKEVLSEGKETVETKKTRIIAFEEYVKVVQDNLQLRRTLAKEEEARLRAVNQRLTQREQLMRDLGSVRMEIFTCIRIRIIQANTLPKMDLIGRGDPFVRIFCRNAAKMTKIINNNSNPIWNEEFIFPLQPPPTLQESIVLQVYDWNDFSSCSKIGTVEIQFATIQALQREGKTLQTYPIKQAKKRLFFNKTSTLTVDCVFGII